MEKIMEEKEWEGETDCECTPEERHGWTKVKLCNHCGKSVESFWKVPASENIFSYNDMIQFANYAKVNKEYTLEWVLERFIQLKKNPKFNHEIRKP
jgi:hypothetical protein